METIGKESLPFFFFGSLIFKIGKTSSINYDKTKEKQTQATHVAKDI